MNARKIDPQNHFIDNNKQHQQYQQKQQWRWRRIDDRRKKFKFVFRSIAEWNGEIVGNALINGNALTLVILTIEIVLSLDVFSVGYWK